MRADFAEKEGRHALAISNMESRTAALQQDVERQQAAAEDQRLGLEAARAAELELTIRHEAAQSLAEQTACPRDSLKTADSNGIGCMQGCKSLMCLCRSWS